MGEGSDEDEGEGRWVDRKDCMADDKMIRTGRKKKGRSEGKTDCAFPL